MPDLKRILDIAASASGLILFSPVIGMVWIVVTVTSKGSAIFAQRRIGQSERPFVCYKFRTMYVGTAQRATHEVSQDAVTPVGRFLRRYKLDELPQLWNVLRGDMSLVGPRPCLETQNKLIEERRRRGVFALRPGITGLAQVEGVDMSKPERLAELDAAYMHKQSLGLDLGLILRTIFFRSQGKRA